MLLLVVVVLLLVNGLRWGVVVLRCGGRGEGGDVGLEMGELSRLGCSYREPWFFSWWKRRKFQGGRRLSRSYSRPQFMQSDCKTVSEC